MRSMKILMLVLMAGSLSLGGMGSVLAEGDDDARERESRGRGRDEARLRGAQDEDENDTRDERRGGRGPHFGRDHDKWLLRNDHIAVWFHTTGSGKAKPDLKVFVNGTDGNESGYRVKLLRLYEAPADDLGHKGRYNHINLARSADWNVETEETPDGLRVTMVHAEAQGIVTLVWHLNTTSAEIKFDTIVENWAWGEEAQDRRLVLDMVVVGRNLRNETGARVSVGESGYITWMPTAEATYGANGTRTLNVTAYQKVSDDEEEDDSRGTHLLLVFDGEGGYGRLVYDPSFGVQSSDAAARSLVPLPSAAFVAVGVAVAALLVRRR